MSELPSPRAGRAELRDDIRARARDLPGVYGILGRDGGLIYVGKSVRVRTRLLSYFRAKEGEKAHRVIEEAERAEWDYTPDEFSALITEMKLIQRHRPRFNVQHKRKRNYAFVKITREPAPRVLPVSRVTEDGSIYYGPFPRVETLKDAVRELVHTLGIRDCTAAMPLHYADQRDIFAWEPSPMCIRAELRTCLAPCCGRPSESRYREAVRAAMHFLEGASTRPLEKLRDAMLAAADREEFEYAAVLRDRHARLQRFTDELTAFRGQVEELSFVYRLVGYDGVARLYAIRGGRVKLCLPEGGAAGDGQGVSDAIQDVFRAPRRGTQALQPEAAAEILLVARWFRLHPDELDNTRPASEWG